MGGNAMKNLGLDPQRVSTEELHQITGLVQEKTSSMLLSCEGVKFHASKTDHGDIDLVGVIPESWAETPEQSREERKAGMAPKPLWVTELQKLLGSPDLHWNPPVVSLLFESTQVDISAHTDPVLAHTQLTFCHYSPTGNIIGKMLSSTGARFGIDGLTYRVRNDFGQSGNTIGKVTLTTDPKEIFAFAGLSHAPWSKGFQTQEDILSWASQCRFFNREIFEFENLNHTNRKRDILRADYHAWREFIQNLPNKVPAVITPEEKAISREAYFKEVCDFFPHLKPEREKLLEEHRLQREDRKTKFNGNLVSKWTGIRGPELGKTLEKFSNSLGEPLETFLRKSSTEEVKTHFMGFMKSQKPNKGPEPEM